MQTTSHSMSPKTLTATSSANVKVTAMVTTLRCRPCARCITGQLRSISMVQVGPNFKSGVLPGGNTFFIRYVPACNSVLITFCALPFAEPINIFHSSYKTDYEPIRLSYHNSVHYNAVLNPNKPSVGVGLGLSGYKPWVSKHFLLQAHTTCTA